MARLERYDRLVYQSDKIPWEKSEGPQVLSLTYWDGWCSAEMDGVPLLDRVSIDPIPGRDRVGLTTWGPDTVIESMELLRGPK